LRTKTDFPSPPGPDPAPGLVRRLARAVYGAYALGLLALVMGLAAVLAFLLPRLEWRRHMTHALARFWLWASGLRVRVTGLDSLPEGSCVLVANHSSYLDGVVMKAVLPPRFGFVVKREAASTPVLGLLLRRIGAEFVDRHSASGRQRAARRVMKRAAAGHSLVFFPEGTFDAQPGLKRFKIGAFVAATRSNAPVVPAVIHGARRALPGDSKVPRPGRILVELLQPIGGHGETPEALREESRRMILARLDEPDLAAAPGRTAEAVA
jgi:1-acyl-sn-glycerol-3-phosphate acyltransferase